jgi:hypothetical protein
VFYWRGCPGGIDGHGFFLSQSPKVKAWSNSCTIDFFLMEVTYFRIDEDLISRMRSNGVIVLDLTKNEFGTQYTG